MGTQTIEEDPNVNTHRSFRRAAIPAALPAALLAVFAGAQTAQASGFAVPEISTAGLGTANAMVANPDERGAFAYNPAAMAFHEKSSLALGGLLIGPSFTVRTDSGRHDSEGADWLIAPMVQAAIRINEQWWAGLGVTAPFGLETRWPLGTFPKLTGVAPPPNPPVPLSPQPTQSKLEILNFTPTASYRVNENLALSAGADFYWAKSAQLNSSITQLEGDGSGWGFNLSALYVKDALSLGINFHSAASVELDGTYTAMNPLLVAAGRLSPSQTGELDVNLPWRLQLGARYEINPKLAVEVDWTRTGWSEFDEIKVTGGLNGSTLIQDQNQWDDANAYRFGATYQLLDQTQLRLGYSYDETGQGDDYFSARIPDNDRHLFSVGVSHALSDGWQVEAGYMYVMFTERDVSGVRPYAGSGGEINGTDAIAGEYDAHAHLIGLEISKTFDAF
jgi:long-chain fatty acid transport protein